MAVTPAAEPDTYYEKLPACEEERALRRRLPCPSLLAGVLMACTTQPPPRCVERPIITLLATWSQLCAWLRRCCAGSWEAHARVEMPPPTRLLQPQFPTLVRWRRTSRKPSVSVRCHNCVNCATL